MKDKLITLGYYAVFLFAGAMYLYLLCWLVLQKLELSGLAHVPD